MIIVYRTKFGNITPYKQQSGEYEKDVPGKDEVEATSEEDKKAIEPIPKKKADKAAHYSPKHGKEETEDSSTDEFPE